MRVDKAQAIKDAEIAYALEEGAEMKTVEIALNLLRIGLSVEQVAAGTGLTVEQIKELQNS